MECDLSDAIMMDAIGLAKSLKRRESLIDSNCKHFLFDDFISSNSYLALQRMILFIENSPCRFNSNYEILKSHLKEVKFDKNKRNDIDNLIKLWASEIGDNDNLIPEFDLLAQKEAKSADATDTMRNELADLADSMKGRALTYKEILSRDNEKLHNSATIHQRELERMEMANQKSKAESSQSISFFRMMVMVVTSVVSLFLCFFVMLLT